VARLAADSFTRFSLFGQVLTPLSAHNLGVKEGIVNVPQT